LQIGSDILLIITSTGDELLRNVSIDDLEYLEPPKLGVLVNFSQLWAEIHISRANCTKMAGNRPRQPAYKIFAIECRF